MPILQPIETKRLLMREINEDDFNDIHMIKSNPEVVKYLTWGPFNEEQTLKSIRKQIAFQHEKDRKIVVLAVTLKENKTVIGNSLLMIDDDYETAEIGYFLHSNHWNKGLGKECIEGLITLAFQHFNLHRIYAQCDVENEGSVNILKKMGFRLEGHFKKNLKVRGKWQDNFLYALLREEYHS